MKTSSNPNKTPRSPLKLLERLQAALLILLPALCFAPRIIPLTALALTALLSLPKVFKKLPLALPLYLAFSLLWSARPSRGLLVLALFLCILITALACRSLWLSERGPKLRNYLEKSLLLGATLASLFCLAQFIADLLGAPRELTLLCPGCTKATFGFPHVNGFTLEPQFMGALLLAPIFLCLKNFRTNRLSPVLLCFFSVTLFLTFSRGACLALLVGLCFSLISTPQNTKTRKSSPLADIYFSLTNPRKSLEPVEKSVENSQKSSKTAQNSLTPHSSLKLLFPYILILTSFIAVFSLQSVLSYQNRPTAAPTPIEHLTNQADSSEITAESKNIRLRLWSDAFHAWKENPIRFLFGAGLGGSGPALHSEDSALGVDTELVQNEYLELLLELGFVGCIILLGTLIRLNLQEKPSNTSQKPTAKTSKSHSQSSQLSPTPQITPLISAFLTALLFFSGLPNALQIYLTLFSGLPQAPPKRLSPKTRAKGPNKDA